MDNSMYLLCIMVALCLGDALSRGIEQKNTFSANLEVVRPWEDCVGSLKEKENISRCDVNLFDTENVQLENMKDIRYLMFVEIGSNKQKFKVKVDTGSDVLWVFGEECDDAEPKCQGHRKFKSGDSDTFEKEDDTFLIQYVAGRISGMTAKDNVFFTKDLEAKKQLFGSVKEVNKKYTGYDGILGINMLTTLGVVSPVRSAMKEAGMDPTFSLFLKGGGSSADGGEITFGGNNEVRFKKDTAIKATVPAGGKFIVQLDEVKFGDSKICTKGGDSYCKASIDSGSSEITGPKKELDAFNKDVLKAEGRKVVCDDIPNFPDMEIKLGDKVLTLKAEHYIRTIKKVDGDDVCYTTLIGIDHPQGIWLLGDPLLRQYYTEFNMKTDEESVTFHELK